MRPGVQPNAQRVYKHDTAYVATSPTHAHVRTIGPAWDVKNEVHYATVWSKSGLQYNGNSTLRQDLVRDPPGEWEGLDYRWWMADYGVSP